MSAIRQREPVLVPAHAVRAPWQQVFTSTEFLRLWGLWMTIMGMWPLLMSEHFMLTFFPSIEQTLPVVALISSLGWGGVFAGLTKLVISTGSMATQQRYCQLAAVASIFFLSRQLSLTASDGVLPGHPTYRYLPLITGILFSLGSFYFGFNREFIEQSYTLEREAEIEREQQLRFGPKRARFEEEEEEVEEEEAEEAEAPRSRRAGLAKQKSS